MDTFEVIRTRLSVSTFSEKQVPKEVKREVLEAARLSPSGLNSQHWRFILVDGRENLKKLAEMSTTGKWVAGANFAVVVLTNAEYPFHLLDAGQAIMSMMLAAWNRGVASRIFTGFDQKSMREFLELEQNEEAQRLSITVVVGFGCPTKKIIGKKNRLPLEKIAFYQRYGQPITQALS